MSPAVMQDMKVSTMVQAGTLMATVHVRNLTPTTVLQWRTTNKAWTVEAPRIDHLLVFGCHIKEFVLSDFKTKLDARSGVSFPQIRPQTQKRSSRLLGVVESLSEEGRDSKRKGLSMKCRPKKGRKCV